jgi:DNA-binding CsgD family transcriptional regulator
MESHIELINSAHGANEAFENFASIVRTYGYDKIAYSLVNDHPSLGLPRQHGFATSYPEDWMNHHNARNYMKIDPVTAKVLSSRAPFFWNQVVGPLPKGDASLDMMNQAADAGLGDGIGISLTGDGHELAGIGLARAASIKPSHNDYRDLADLYLLSVFFHYKFRNLISPPTLPAMSKRELDILSWGAEGKTDEDIGTILNISFATVRFHWTNIFRKLNANSRVYAITKATHMKLISPASIAYSRASTPST